MQTQPIWTITESNEDSNIYTVATKSCVICNSCRYCEGLCATFPAMERYREFSPKDIDYLANLCHQCSECFYDCQYAPPHEFNVSIPAQFAQIRKESYKKHAFPAFLSKAFDKNALLSTVLLVVIVFLGFALPGFMGEVDDTSSGNFFTIISSNGMVAIFGVVASLVFVALCVSCLSYAKSLNLPPFSFSAFLCTIKDTLSLKYLGGHNSEGCTYPHIQRSNMRRYFHHFVMYGFIFCLIATTLGAIYSHVFDIQAPYDITQSPKLFGSIGGILICIGVVGLLVLKLKADVQIKDSMSIDMDYVLLGMLFFASISGLMLMCFKESMLLAVLLWFHLSCVLTFFIMIPYSKFLHVFYRFMALYKYNAEEANEA